jgi:hypothetical protein
MLLKPVADGVSRAEIIGLEKERLPRFICCWTRATYAVLL